MARLSDIRPKINDYFSECEYRPIGDLVGRDLVLIDFARFENREGADSMALKLTDGEDSVRTVTHAKAIIDMICCDEVRQALGEGGVECRIVQKKSEKTGRNYLTLE